MNRRNLICGLAASAGASAAADARWANGFARQLRDDFLAHWRVEKQYSLDVLESMPSDRFDFRPTAAQRSFAEQMAHYASSNVNYFKNFGKQARQPQPAADLSRNAVRTYLIESYDYVDAVLESLSESDFTRRDVDMGRMPVHTAQDVFLRAYMHSAHHRGSVVVYLRLVGVEPPRWRFPAQGKA